MLAGPKRSVGSVASLVIIISLLFPAYSVSLTYGLVFQASLYLLSLAHLFGPRMGSVITQSYLPTHSLYKLQELLHGDLGVPFCHIVTLIFTPTC